MKKDYEMYANRIAIWRTTSILDGTKEEDNALSGIVIAKDKRNGKVSLWWGTLNYPSGSEEEDIEKIMAFGMHFPDYKTFIKHIEDLVSVQDIVKE